MVQIPGFLQPNFTEPPKITFAGNDDIDVTEWKGDILFVCVTEKDLAKDESSKFKNPIMKNLDSHLSGLLVQVFSEEDFTGKTGKTTVVSFLPGLGAKQIGLIGLGQSASSPSYFHSIGEAVASSSNASQFSSVLIVLASPDSVPDESKLSSASALASGIVFGVFLDSMKPTLESVDIIGFGTFLELEKKLMYAEDVSPANVLTSAVLDSDNLTINGRNQRLKTSMNRGEDLLDDLIIEIFLRLPVKSVGICRCLSKHWDSMLRQPYFTDTFLIKSSARPQILFACQKNSEVYFFSLPQPQKPDENLSLVAATNHLSQFPLNYDSYGTFHSIRGLVFYINKLPLKGKKQYVQVICNPSTGQSTILPKMYTKRGRMMSYIGYDPVDKQLKVLSMTWRNGMNFEEHQVLSFGNGHDSWRKIKCCLPHFSSSKGICINGVLYYPATTTATTTKANLLVCFDVKSEKFSFINVIEETLIKAVSYGTLIDYNGKLGLLQPNGNCLMFVDKATTGFTFWILDDITEEWSSHEYEFPPLLEITGKAMLRFLGMTQTNDVVFSSSGPPNLISLYYYNIDKKTIRRVQIQGMDECVRSHTFLHHVEDVKLM